MLHLTKLNFKLNHIDHVAIRVKSASESIAWYESVLGFKAVRKEAWGNYPIIMVKGKCIIAIFPSDRPRVSGDKKMVRIDHFAFNVDNANFENARSFFKQNGIQYDFQDHQYFHSMYLKDPDQHKVELTTLVIEDPDFGKLQ